VYCEDEAGRLRDQRTKTERRATILLPNWVAEHDTRRDVMDTGSVRIVGNNRRIADWFKQHFSRDDVVEAKVLDTQHVLVMLPRR
jgi:hypothetical protein